MNKIMAISVTAFQVHIVEKSSYLNLVANKYTD